MRETACSPWAVLGLDEGATLAEVRRAYRQRAKTTHPDRGGSRGEFEEVRAAFDALIGLAKRDAEGEPEPCRQPRRRVAPGTRPHVAPAPAGVVRAYRWTADAATTRAVWGEGAAPVESRRPRLTSTPPASAAAFAAVLDSVLARTSAAA